MNEDTLIAQAAPYIVTLKKPYTYDVSHWKIIKDFRRISPKPWMMLTKASEGFDYQDNTFVPYMRGMLEIGCHRGCFHFFRKQYPGAEQAKLFIRTIRDHIDPHTILVLDVEEEDTPVSRMWDFCQHVREAFPKNLLMIYGRKEQMDRFRMAEAEKKYFRQIPVWAAGYPNEPDKFKDPPLGYQPNRDMWGPTWLWQYTKAGEVIGIVGRDIDTVGYIDCNWVSGALQMVLGEPGPALPPVEEEEDMAVDLGPLTEAINRLASAIEKGGTSGGGGGTIPTPARESVYQVIERDANMNGLVVFYKSPDINETNVDRVPVKPAQTIHVINNWAEVPGELVGWKQMTDIEKQNTYIEWVCVHEKQIKNANGKWRAFPEIFLAGGTTRAEYCWMQRSCLGAKVS